jgi:DNA-binding PadR family transcriptional regulator
MPRSDGSPDSFLPLRPVDALILTALVEEERHGYAIRQEVVDQTAGRVELEAGNLYRFIRRLEDEGLLATSSRRPAAGEDPRRVYYRLTPLGRRVLAAEFARMRALVEMAESRRIIEPRTV